MQSNNKEAFLALVRAGLWEKDVRLSMYDNIDFSDVYLLAEGQSLLGIVAAGIEHIQDVRAPQEVVLQFVGNALQLEQRNNSMNIFIADLVDNMRKKGIYTLLVKGQGIAQCYEKPLWRSSGDIDFLLSENNYCKAREYLLSLSSGNKNEERYSQHLGMNIGSWYVEIHGSLRTGLSSRVDRVVDDVQKDVFFYGNVRSWQNGIIQVFLPAPTNDVFFVFTHFIKHFYKEGMNLRQVCDWCRLLWTYRKDIKTALLKLRLQKAGLLSEWKAFAALAVDYLGMPSDIMPIYEDIYKWHRKATQILNFILFEYKHNVVKDTFVISRIFPCDTLRFIPSIFFNVNGLKLKERLWSSKLDV